MYPPVRASPSADFFNEPNFHAVEAKSMLCQTERLVMFVIERNAEGQITEVEFTEFESAVLDVFEEWLDCGKSQEDAVLELQLESLRCHGVPLPVALDFIGFLLT
jgi:hypothetical protein